MILFLSSLKKMVPLCFALDHTHYSRWLSVFIHDLELLRIEDEELFKVLGENLSVKTSEANQIFKNSLCPET